MNSINFSTVIKKKFSLQTVFLKIKHKQINDNLLLKIDKYAQN